MNEVSITSDYEKPTPIYVQNAIKNRFVFSKNKEVEARIDGDGYHVYQKDEYVCSFDENGNPV